jgi:hypothetical protein
MTLTTVACSGDVANGAYLDGDTVFNDFEHKNEPPQLTRVGPNTSLITLTMGGNNVGFAGEASNCVSADLNGDSAACVGQDNTILNRLGYITDAGKASDGTFTGDHGAISATGLTLSQLVKRSDQLNGQSCPQTSCFPAKQGNLHDALVLLFRALQAHAPGARIMVLGYPRFFPAGGTGSDCEHFTQIDQSWINDRIQLLNSITADAASESGVAQYVNVYNSLAGHELCTGTPNFAVDPTTYAVAPCTGAWINGIDLIHGFFGSPELLHPNPCGHQSEGQLTAAAYKAGDPSIVDQYSLPGAGSTHTTSINVPAGTRRLTVTSKWAFGSVGWTLTDPQGNTDCNAQLTTYCPAQAGPVYSVWTVWNPPAGQWTLAASNQTAGDTGYLPATVSVSYDQITALPPAGVVQPTSESCTVHKLFTDCTASLIAAVAKQATGRVTGFNWFDNTGAAIGSGPAVTVSGSVPFNVILKTLAANGQYRYTSFTVKCFVCGSSRAGTASLSKDIAPNRTTLRIGTLLKENGYSMPFTARSPGRLTIRWYATPARMSTGATRPLLVATGATNFSQPGAGQIKMTLTGRGRQRLKHAGHVALTAAGTFAPSGQRHITSFRRFTLSR